MGFVFLTLLLLLCCENITGSDKCFITGMMKSYINCISILTGLTNSATFSHLLNVSKHNRCANK